jgi:hypothetical protein
MLRIVLWDFRYHASEPVVIEETTTTMAGSAEEEEASAEEESGQPVPDSPKFRPHNPKNANINKFLNGPEFKLNLHDWPEKSWNFS